MKGGTCAALTKRETQALEGGKHSGHSTSHFKWEGGPCRAPLERIQIRRESCREDV